MSAAGLTVGGFYAHFASKDDLVAHAVEHMFHERYEEFLGLLDVGDPRAAIAKFFDGYLRSEEHTSELQSLMRISYAVFCLKKKKQKINENKNQIIRTNKNT